MQYFVPEKRFWASGFGRPYSGRLSEWAVAAFRWTVSLPPLPFTFCVVMYAVQGFHGDSLSGPKHTGPALPVGGPDALWITHQISTDRSTGPCKFSNPLAGDP